MTPNTTIKKLADKIEYCLNHYPETRNSDIALTIKIWEIFHARFIVANKGGVKWVKLADLYSLPREDNVKRIRAKIQSPKKFMRTHSYNDLPRYLPTERTVRRKRKINEDTWKTFLSLNVSGYRYDNKQRTIRRIG